MLWPQYFQIYMCVGLYWTQFPRNQTNISKLCEISKALNSICTKHLGSIHPCKSFFFVSIVSRTLMNLQKGYDTALTYRHLFKLPLCVKHPVCWPQMSKPAQIPIILFLNGCQTMNQAEGQWVNVCPLSLHPFISLKRISMLHTAEDVSFKTALVLWWVTCFATGE